MNNSKIRTTIIVLAAMLAVAAVPAVSAAAVKSPKVGAAAPVVKTTTVKALDAGSAGIPGYSDSRCRALIADALKAADVMMQEYDAGTPNSSRAKQASEIGNHAWKEASDNCLIVY